jgi:glucose/arabinose dehydrogenase
MFDPDRELRRFVICFAEGRDIGDDAAMNKPAGTPAFATRTGRLRPGAWAMLVLTIFALVSDIRSARGSWAVSYTFTNLTFAVPTCFVPEPRTNRLYVCEQTGQIYFFTNDPSVTGKTLFLDLTAVTQAHNDCGVLGFAFHPEYGQAGSTNRGYVYVYYCYSPTPTLTPDVNTVMYDRLSRFTVPDGSLSADPASELVLINQFDRNFWHNGGGMFFGSDGFLYLANGDEGGAFDSFNNSQIINSGFFSGIFRIDVDNNASRSHPIRRYLQDRGGIPAGWPPTTNGNYMVPNDNPWLDPGGSVLEEFFAIGLRNPFHVTFDPPTGNIWAGDVGESVDEEVDLIQKGGNYQWAYEEGSIPGPKPRPAVLIGNDTPPIYSYMHTPATRCIMGGYVYRGAQFPSLTGLYFFGDFEAGRIWTLAYTGSSPAVVQELCALPLQSSLTAFGLDQSGEIYFCSYQDGKIMKLNQRPDPAPFVVSSTLVSNNQVRLSFTNFPGLSFSLVTANDPTLPLTNWLWVEAAAENSPGNYGFTNRSVAGAPAYYRVRQP